jgi:uncharacterized damage-inducible protein DinB
MSALMVDADVILRWNDETGAGWEKFFAANPAALDLPCDIAGVVTVRDLVKHIVAVEIRYAQRLSEEAVSAYEELENSMGAMFALHHEAMGKYRALMAKDGLQWAEVIEMQTRSAGILKASRKKVLLHAQLHGIRHWAQLATLVRQHGLKPGWPMDFLMCSAME